MITPTASFRDNLLLMPSVENLIRIDLTTPDGDIVASIENQPGKQGSLVVYQYLKQVFGTIDAKAAAHGMEVFAEHTQDAKKRPGTHPNIDRLLDIVEGSDALDVQLVHA